MKMKTLDRLVYAVKLMENYLLIRMEKYSVQPSKEIRHQIEQKIKITKKRCLVLIARIVKEGYYKGQARAEKRARQLADRERTGPPAGLNEMQAKARQIVLRAFEAMEDEIQAILMAFRTIRVQNFNPTIFYQTVVNRIIKESQKIKERVTRTGHKYMAVMTRQEVRKKIQEQVSKIWGQMKIIPIRLKNGKIRRYQPRKYFELVGRTEMIRASTQATKDVTLDYGLDLVQVSSHHGACPICIPFEGQIYSLKAGHPVYEEANDLPPFHPHCQHSINPISLLAIEKIKEINPQGIPRIKRGLTVAKVQAGLRAQRKKAA